MPGSLEDLKRIVGSTHVITDPDVLAGRSVDHTGRYRGRASALVRPGSPEQGAEGLRGCLGAGAVPDLDDVLPSPELLSAVGDVDIVERRVASGAGATMPAVQPAAAAA